LAEEREEMERNRPEDPKTLIKKQFVMSKSTAQPVQMQKMDANGDFTTSNGFYH